MSPLFRSPVHTFTALIISGVFYALAFPPVDLWFFIVPSLALLFLALERLTPKAAFLAGFLWGIIALGIGFSWFWNIFGVMSLALVGILASFVAMFGWFQARARAHSWPQLRITLLIAVAWTALEFIRGEIFWLRFPWLTVGTAMPPGGLLPWIGTYGVGLSITLASIMLAMRQKGSIISGISLLALTCSSCYWSVSEKKTGDIRIAAIQAEGVPPEDYVRMSKSIQPAPQIIVWPEYAFPGDLMHSKPYRSQVQDLSESTGAILILGAQTYLPGQDWHNTALTLFKNQLLGVHHKQHTVHLFDDGKPGSAAEAIATPLGRVGTPVCFDCDFQDVVREMTLAGAGLIIAPTMDAAHWSERQHLQHAKLFRLRAAENRRWIAVAASSGLTQIINPEGTVQQSLPLMQPGILNGTVSMRQDLTFYTRFGWMLPWVLLAMAALACLPLLRRPRRTVTSAH